MPEPRLGVPLPGEPGDPSDGRDDPVPLGPDPAASVEGFDQTVFLPTVSIAIDGAVAVEGRQVGAGRLDRPVQRGLVGLDLGDQDISGLSGGFEGFFWQCMASAVKMTPLSPRVRIISSAAGISFVFSAISLWASKIAGSEAKAIRA